MIAKRRPEMETFKPIALLGIVGWSMTAKGLLSELNTLIQWHWIRRP
jgi:hypothetical protein